MKRSPRPGIDRIVGRPLIRRVEERRATFGRDLVALKRSIRTVSPKVPPAARRQLQTGINRLADVRGAVVRRRAVIARVLYAVGLIVGGILVAFFPRLLLVVAVILISGRVVLRKPWSEMAPVAGVGGAILVLLSTFGILGPLDLTQLWQPGWILLMIAAGLMLGHSSTELDGDVHTAGRTLAPASALRRVAWVAPAIPLVLVAFILYQRVFLLSAGSAAAAEARVAPVPSPVSLSPVVGATLTPTPTSPRPTALVTPTTTVEDRTILLPTAPPATGSIASSVQDVSATSSTSGPEAPTSTPTLPVVVHTPVTQRTATTRPPVLVLNGNGKAGSAAAIALLVRANGYPDVSVGDAGRFDYPATTIAYPPADSADANALGRIVAATYHSIDLAPTAGAARITITLGNPG